MPREINNVITSMRDYADKLSLKQQFRRRVHLTPVSPRGKMCRSQLTHRHILHPRFNIYSIPLPQTAGVPGVPPVHARVLGIARSSSSSGADGCRSARLLGGIFPRDLSEAEARDKDNGHV